MIRQLGPVKATIVITLLAIVTSVSITTVSILIVYDASVLPFGMTLSALLPGMIAPAIAYTIFRLVARLEQTQREKEAVILELQEALTNVKRLGGLLPICASCKKIRDDEGYWHQVEVYIHTHSDADFSHGICPDCVQALYPKASRRPLQENQPS